MLVEVSLCLINDHSIMVQNVSASFKAENLWPQWLKMALSAHSCWLLQAQDMLLNQSAILALETTKYWKEVVVLYEFGCHQCSAETVSVFLKLFQSCPRFVF